MSARRVMSLAECERAFGLRHGTAGKAVRSGKIKGRVRGNRILVSSVHAELLWGVK